MYAITLEHYKSLKEAIMDLITDKECTGGTLKNSEFHELVLNREEQQKYGGISKVELCSWMDSNITNYYGHIRLNGEYLHMDIINNHINLTNVFIHYPGVLIAVNTLPKGL